jgi:hypothetical protein
MDFFRGQQWESLTQIEAQLTPKNRSGSRPCAITAVTAVISYISQ